MVDYLDLLGDECGPLLVVAGVLVAAGAMRWATKHFGRVCREHGAALASCGLTGQLVAQRLLARSGLSDVTVLRSKRRNFYHPWKRQIRLSTQTIESPSLYALAAAAHEVGHAQQFACKILVCRLRTVLWPVCWVLIGLVVALPILQIAGLFTVPIANLGYVLLGLMAALVLVQLPIELPLEYDASRRARRLLAEEKLLVEAEAPSVDAILKAAWLTYAARLAQGGIALTMVAFVLFLYPTFTGAARVEIPDRMPDPPAEVVQVLPRPATVKPGETVPMAEEMDDLLAINLFPSLFSSLLGIIPCLLMYLVLARLAPGRRRPRSPAERAIERNNAGLALNEKGALPAAIHEFDEALQLDPGLAPAYYNRGQTYLRLGRLDEALADFEANLRIKPQYAYAIAACAQVWMQRGDLDRALAEIDRALSLAPENPTFLTMRAATRLRRTEIEAALADLEAALRYNPRDPLTYTLRGQIWLHSKDHDRAIADLSEALKLDPRQAAAWRDRGLSWFFKNQFDRAVADLDEAIRLDPADGYAFNNRGAALARLGAHARAAADLREAIRLAPDLPNPYRHLAWLQATCPEPEFRNGAEAVANATRALELVGWKNEEWLPVLAAAHAEAGNFDQAAQWQRKCLEQSPNQSKPELESRLRLYAERKPFRDPV
jgi:Zn-dependent membrane protease YugP/Flp pilus assembly protein TadD